MAYDGVTVVEIVLGREGLWGLRNRNLVPIGGLIQLRNATLEDHSVRVGGGAVLVGSAFGGGAVAGVSALQALTSCASLGNRRVLAGVGDGGYGPLKDAGPELALPRGFQYRVLCVEGQKMSDGYRAPGEHDGMCAFPLPNGNIRLIRNHEVQNAPSLNAAMGDPATAYDRGAGGGTVSLEVHPETREVIRDFVSLNGTWRNCAGGPTPWGSWSGRWWISRPTTRTAGYRKASISGMTPFPAPRSTIFSLPWTFTKWASNNVSMEKRYPPFL